MSSAFTLPDAVKAEMLADATARPQTVWPSWFPKDMIPSHDESNDRRNAARNLASSSQALIWDQHERMQSTAALLNEADGQIQVHTSC